MNVTNGIREENDDRGMNDIYGINVICQELSKCALARAAMGDGLTSYSSYSSIWPCH